MGGRLITFEGTDGSGKSTPFQLLCSRLEKEGVTFRAQRFPRYESPSSAPIRMYLAGEFGNTPEDINPYSAASFYAVDRAAAFSESLFSYYDSGGVIICDRYTPSNAIHQGAKLTGPKADDFLHWLFDYEYERLALPRPSLTLFLDMPENTALALLKERDEKAGTHPDIHETSLRYLKRCRETAAALASSEGWTRISAALPSGRPRPPGDVAEEVYAAVLNTLNL